MPNINRPFVWDESKSGPCICYKCGEKIENGTTPWSFNTHGKQMFAHGDCATQSKTPILPKTTQQVKTPGVYSNLKKSYIFHTNFFPVTSLVIAKKKEEVKPEIKPEIKIERKPDLFDKITPNGKHETLNGIIRRFRQGKYPFLYGAPGAGKTHLMQSIAQDMGLDFVLISCANDMFKSEIVGSVSPVNGTYIAQAFYFAWQNGGVILFDECGLASGAFLNVLNAALAQKEIRFPNRERVAKHKNCYIAFADNSALYGNDPLFPERQDAGGAFRDRLSYVEFTYDTKLELMILTNILGNAVRASKLHRIILDARRIATGLNEQGVKVFVSPRFAYAFAADIRDKVFVAESIHSELIKGQTKDEIAQAKSVVDILMGAMYV